MAAVTSRICTRSRSLQLINTVASVSGGMRSPAFTPTIKKAESNRRWFSRTGYMHFKRETTITAQPTTPSLPSSPHNSQPHTHFSTTSSTKTQPQPNPTPNNSAESAPSEPSTPLPPPHLSPSELAIFTKLVQGLNPSKLVVKDVSGGCGSMYAIEVTSSRFKGLGILKQQRLVNEVLGREMVEGWHGVQIKTFVG